MQLAEKLEKRAKKLDAARWRGMQYDVEKVELSDLLSEAAKKLREYAANHQH